MEQKLSQSLPDLVVKGSMMSEMDEVIREFLVESYENLEQVDLDLLSLEEDPSNKDILNRIFRAVHTIKGTCGFLDFNKLESVAHVGENLLDMMREGTLSLTPDIASGLLEMVDAIRSILSRIEETNLEGDEEYVELRERLKLLQLGETPVATTPPVVEDPVPEVTSATGEFEVPTPPESAQLNEIQQEVATKAKPVQQETVAPVPAEAAATGNSKKNPAKKADDDSKTTSVADSTIRVEVNLLDQLMNLVGELVLARNQILQFASVQKEDAGLLATSQRLNLITTELQEMFMKTRMQPISTVWNKFPRVVRDLAKICGKKVRVEMEGKETECDKTLIEAIKDPLTHVVRNSIDHGIETPEVRAANGKDEEGVLYLRAFHEGGSVNIEIQDDGGGLPTDKIKAKALERGLISEEDAEKMTERQAAALVFRAGFSTADQVSNVSGRGVGMDVVKTNIEKIGGKIEVHSTLGEGTLLRIKIPLTLAIVPALTVTSGAERFAIPQISLVELVRLEAEQVATGIEQIQGASVYRLRGKLLPIVYLNEQLGIGQRQKIDPEIDGIGELEPLNIVVLQAENKTFGLVVDEVNDTQEIVVKPVGTHLQGVSVFAGATIMGDGCVALILDVLGVAMKAKVVSENRDGAGGAEVEEAFSEELDMTTLLLFQSPDDGRMAVPISKIARLEEFTRDMIETAGSKEVVQYRDEIMPLLSLSAFLPERRANSRSEHKSDDEIHVLVYNHGQKSVGIVVEKILDILDAAVTVKGGSSRPGILGTAVIQDRVTELLDLEGVIQRFDPSFFESSMECEKTVEQVGS